MAKPRDRSVNAPLELSLIEALYLVEMNRVAVLQGDRQLAQGELRDIALGKIPRFEELYAVYRDLRRRGLIPRRGLKFGCDYLVYRHGPGIDHAPFGVQVFRVNEIVDPVELVRMGRLLHSVRKKLVIAIYNEGAVAYHLLEWWRP
ncbi:tRNA intron endonuclease [Desulfurococcus mucosus DSM 2162]|uniref:tRNA intron endonuclease n=1 Tax=Desulfurococcus mucosus (strain ATCC 35584 / DSM 2162 / JCM 9187 / O7/1) TaxID=765177 RepID=E8R7S5_DESM0|nr:tRNA intron endonuclease [Desulfurococcus mucosus DSM 2162]